MSTLNWEDVSSILLNYYSVVNFKVDNYTITARNERISETKSHIVIYVNGEFKGSWTKENFPIIEKVFFLKRKKLWSKKYVNKILSGFPKRVHKKIIEEEELDKVLEFLVPTFPSFISFKRKFQKIENLSLLIEQVNPND